MVVVVVGMLVLVMGVVVVVEEEGMVSMVEAVDKRDKGGVDNS